MSTARQHFFVYVTTTYTRSKKWDVVLAKFPFDSGTCSEKLMESICRWQLPQGVKGGSWPVSRVLSRTAIPLGAVSPQPSSSLPGSTRDPRCVLRRYFPIWPCSRWGLPCRPCCHVRGALLPHRFTLASVLRRFGGLFSVALSVGSRPPGVTWHLVHWSPDFPPRDTLRYHAATARPAPRAHLIRRRAPCHSAVSVRR
jgi:hypothetical protein